MAHVDRPVRLVVAGDGTQRANTERVAEELGIADRVDFLGTVDDERLIALYANALAVVFAPFDEDYGYVTLEAFLARRPVVTATDSGGPLEFVAGRRERRSRRTDPRSGRGGAQSPCRATAGLPLRSAMPDTTRRRR